MVLFLSVPETHLLSLVGFILALVAQFPKSMHLE